LPLNNNRILSQTISITAIASISPLGNTPELIWENYLTEKHCFVERDLDFKKTFVAALDATSEQVVTELRESDNKYKSLDKSVLYAMVASRNAMQNRWTCFLINPIPLFLAVPFFLAFDF